uniref:Uncharacterized protein n=1 Tax=Arundo donax TaxID=35708 RepID=A0A0A9G6E2_ARUDO
MPGRPLLLLPSGRLLLRGTALDATRQQGKLPHGRMELNSS